MSDHSQSESPQNESLFEDEDIGRVPVTKTNVPVPLTPEALSQLKEKARRLGGPMSELMRRGLDWIFRLGREDPAEALGEVLKPSDLYPERPSGEGTYSFELRPARMAGLLETTATLGRAGRDLSEQGASASSPSESSASESSASGPVVPEGRPRCWQPSLRKRIVRAAGRCAIQVLEPESISPGPRDGKPAYQLFEKRPGADRGGVQASMAITRSAKKRLAEKAAEMSQEAADLARRATREMIRWIETDPERAFKRIQEESDLYQPPRQGGYQYTYQLYMRIQTKRLLGQARALLARGPGRDLDRAVTEREILQAAARRAIEVIDTEVPPPGAALSGPSSSKRDSSDTGNGEET